MISVFTLRHTLIVNTKIIIKEQFSNILFQNCVSNWKLFALVHTQEGALSYRRLVTPDLGCRFNTQKQLKTGIGNLFG